MTRRVAAAALSLLAVSSLPAPARGQSAGAFLPGPDCEESLPLVLNAAVSPSGRLEPKEVNDLAGRLFRSLYRESACAKKRPLQVNLAIGSDYQILDWIREGTVDVAIVSILSLHLLQQDAIELLEIELPEELSAAVLRPSRPLLRSRTVTAAGVAAERTPEEALEDFATFRQSLWDAVAADGAGLERVRRRGEYLCEEVRSAQAPAGRLTLPSHLSTVGFLAPVAETQAWLRERLPGFDVHLQPVAEACFWAGFFRHACFILEGDKIQVESSTSVAEADPCVERWSREAPEEGLLEIRIERRAAGTEEVVPLAGVGNRPVPGPAEMGLPGRQGSRLVIRRTAAEAVFGPGAFPPAEVRLPETVLELLERAAAPDAGRIAAPEVFRSLARPEPYFGVRTYAFTVDEVVRLIREHQRISGRRGVALVLPGGGVKAAYQSRLVDSQYSGGYLRNAGAGIPGQAVGPDGIDVHHVIGTSGGALLGYFVARLGPKGPWELSRLLWEKDDGQLLSAGDVFGSADLPRYLSVFVIFFLFCGVLALFSAGTSSSLSPKESAPNGGAWRFRLTLVVAPLVLATPFLVREAGGTLDEHVPEIQGLLFLILIVLAMFADQCVIFDREETKRQEPRVRAATYAALTVGILGIMLPLGGTFLGGADSWVARDLSFGLAHLVLGALVLVAGMVLPVRGAVDVRTRQGRWRALGVASDAILVLVLLPLLALWMTPTLWLIESLPVFLDALLLMLLVGGVRLVSVADRGPRLNPAWQWSFYYLALAAATVLLLGLCRPTSLDSSFGLGEVFLEPSKLRAPTGAFLICVAALITLVAGMAWVVASRPRYALRHKRQFLGGVLVAIAHVVMVYGALLALGWWWPNGPSMFELTWGFWLWVLGLGLVSALLIAALGALQWKKRPVIPFLQRSLRHLCSHHPNGALLSRRFLRMLLLGGAGLIWWNVVLAPALYGNRLAEDFLSLAMNNFDQRYAELHQSGDPYRLSAHFVAPANVLEKDGTRYFVLVPEERDCPALPRRNGPGAIWYLYHSDTGPLDHPGHGACRSLDLRTVEDRRFMKLVVFASGSPFPIFPGKLTELPPPDGGWRRLVDGGYSNDTPVEAALVLGADQVLIIQSSHPLGHPSTPSLLGRVLGVLSIVPGPMVKDLGRLPGYLFERSQQVDRKSRRDLFVVTLAPRRSERDWPALSDFRHRTVERMRAVAGEDLVKGRRIGFVESWGPPKFQLSVTVQ